MAFIAQSESGASVRPLCYITVRFLHMQWKQKVESNMDLGFITASELSTFPGPDTWGATEVSCTLVEIDEKVLRA